MTKFPPLMKPTLAHIECDAALTPAGKPYLLADAGISVKGAVGIYHWCRVCHRSHLFSLERLVSTLCKLEDSRQVHPSPASYKENLAQAMMELLQAMQVQKEEIETAWQRAEIRRRVAGEHTPENPCDI